MINAKARRRILINQFLLLLMGIVIVYLMADFARQLAVHYQRREELRQLDAEIELALQKQQDLEMRRAYVQSPQAAEEWARENGLAKEGEQSVVIVAPESAAALPSEEDAGAGPAPVSPRDSWWDLFFGRR